MKYKIIETYNRGSQIEMKYDLLDDSDNLICGGLTKTIGEKKLDKPEIEKLFNTAIFPAFQEEPEEQEKTYTETEIVEILVGKNYLVAGQKLDELAVKEVKYNGNL